ncbi:hypothetical protein R6Q59_019534 [Mikania micrantha]
MAIASRGEETLTSEVTSDICSCDEDLVRLRIATDFMFLFQISPFVTSLWLPAPTSQVPASPVACAPLVLRSVTTSATLPCGRHWRISPATSVLPSGTQPAALFSTISRLLLFSWAMLTVCVVDAEAEDVVQCFQKMKPKGSIYRKQYIEEHSLCFSFSVWRRVMAGSKVETGNLV